MISPNCLPPPSLLASPWQTRLIGPAFKRAFAPLPPEPIWQWADATVWLVSEDAAEPGPYRSAKTPWTRRLQELIRKPVQWCWDFQQSKYVPINVTEISIQKSSQSGFSEACLNGVRWRATHRPCNIIFAIDTVDQAKKVARRLLRSLKFLDPAIFTGDADDIKSTEFLLRGMELYFIGSFSEGGAAQKQAPLVFVDELDEHGLDILGDLASRKKTAGKGLQVNLSKPKLENGPINKAFKLGNQEEFFCPCPHCGHYQPITFESEEMTSEFSEKLLEIRDEQSGEIVAILPEPLPLGQKRKFRTGRIVFEHCKDILGHWDKMRIAREAYYECPACIAKITDYERLQKENRIEEAAAFLTANQASISSKGRIEEFQKQSLSDAGRWLPLVHGTPGIVSQHMHDLLSTDPLSSWNRIILEFLDASKAGATKLQTWLNHRLGKTRKQEANKTDESTLTANIGGQPGDGFAPYRRGIVPFVPRMLILGSDVGLDYVRWTVTAVAQNLEDCAVVDWGNEVGPAEIAELMLTRKWALQDGSKTYMISLGFMDSKYQKTYCYRAALTVLKKRGKHCLVPTAGLGGSAARKIEFSYTHIPSYPPAFMHLTFRDELAKNDLYIDCLSKKKRHVWLPVDVLELRPTDGPDISFPEELCGERYVIEPGEPGRWADPPLGPNHWGDALKNAVLGLRFFYRQKTSAPPPATEPPPEPAV